MNFEIIENFNDKKAFWLKTCNHNNNRETFINRQAR